MLINGTFVGYCDPVWESQDETDQIVNEMADGSVRVHDRSPATRVLRVTLPRVTNSDFATLRTALAVTNNFSETPITITLDDGNPYTVRYWDPKIRAKQRLGSFWTVELTFRVEV
jgi:hypothetical protein